MFSDDFLHFLKIKIFFSSNSPKLSCGFNKHILQIEKCEYTCRIKMILLMYFKGKITAIYTARKNLMRV